jgi:hypothetical protein
MKPACLGEKFRDTDQPPFTFLELKEQHWSYEACLLGREI